MAIVTTKKLTKTYGKSRGIKDVNISINKGEIYGFIGPNGAGKSTTIKILLNFINKSAGEAEVFDKDVSKFTDDIKKDIGYVPSEVKYYKEVRAKDIIDYAVSFYQDIDKEYVQELCDYFELDEKKKIEELSLGNKKKVAIIQALINKPKLLILDEPTGGLDPILQAKLFEKLLELKKQDVTIFISSHNLAEVEKFCDKVAIIKNGEIVDIIEIATQKANLKTIITINAKECEKELINNIDEILYKDSDMIKFTLRGDVNSLISSLAKINIQGICIKEESLEDKFIKYYEV